MPLPLNPLEWVALAYLGLLWIGYGRYAKHRACRQNNSPLSNGRPSSKIWPS